MTDPAEPTRYPMTRYLMTRGHSRALDYDWLGRRPPQRWWDRYGGYTFFEHPTVIVEATGASRWRAFLSGIPSQRQDAVGRSIQYVLMLTGARSDPAAVAEGVRVLASALLDPAALGKALDQQFDEAMVSSCLTEPGSRWDEVSEHLVDVVAQLAPLEQQVEPFAMADGELSWAGDGSGEGHLGLLARAAGLVDDATARGLAALLNLVEPARLPLHLVQAGSGAFLVTRSDAPWQPVPKPRPSLDGAQPRPRPRPGRLTRLAVTALVAVLVAGVLAYFLFRTLSGQN